MRVLAQAEILMENKALRVSSVANIGRARKDYIKFAEAHHLPPIPESQVEVSAYITYSIHHREPVTLDSSTLTGYVAGNGTFITALRNKLDVKLFNPIRGLRIKGLMKVARDDYKKESKVKLPWTITEFKRMVHSGFPKTRVGKHQRMCLITHTLGVLRPKAGANLRVKFALRGRRIIYHKDSAFKVKEVDGIKHIEINVIKDKNVNSRKVRTTYIPYVVTQLNINCVDEFRTTCARAASILATTFWRRQWVANARDASHHTVHQPQQGLQACIPQSSPQGGGSYCRAHGRPELPQVPGAVAVGRRVVEACHC